MKILLSVWFWLASTIITIILFFVVFFIVVFTFPFDKKRKLAHAQCFWWSNCVIRLNPYWKLRLEGRENIDRNKTYVIIANHQSLADIAVLYKIHMQFKWVSKESLFKVPFIGWCLALTKHIRLERGDFSSIKKLYRQAGEWLRRDMSVLFFPEGTRSDSDAMNVFQNGAFKLAIKEKKPILPICIRGTREAIPKGSWIFRARVCATLKVLPALDTSSLSPGDFGALRDTVFARITNA
ncbi:MAG: lysophospholipid acyltransferase family protein [Candidatus Omnitrophica bacterium]|nr:lysophospholipid acyltransferase family protein [Candidatus Omnitrophota bacterium]MDD5026976.1 lysophospholipid acyltransferase family protein [Candidatus Omnitrophota bacterium]MDD5661654.1 lysophospholipid acyltransferase family protein [Candidatus Omnitrophota bacterium]